MIEDANNAFNQCVRSGALTAIGVGVITTLWDRGKDPTLNIADTSLDLQGDCLAKNPLAFVSPNYHGVVEPGEYMVDPIMVILGWKVPFSLP